MLARFNGSGYFCGAQHIARAHRTIKHPHVQCFFRNGQSWQSRLMSSVGISSVPNRFDTIPSLISMKSPVVYGSIALPFRQLSFYTTSISTNESNDTNLVVNPVQVNTPDASPFAPDIESNQFISNVMNIPEVHRLGDLGVFGIAKSTTPTGWMGHLLEYIHVYSGLPWWGTILAFSFGIRIVFVHWMLKNASDQAKNEYLQDKFAPIKARMDVFKQQGRNYEARKEAVKMEKLMKQHDLNPLALLGRSLVQLPIIACTFMTLRSMANCFVPSYVVGGTLWFQNLAVPDPLHILPVAATLMTFVNVHLSAQVNPKMQRFSKVLSILSLTSLIFTWRFPVGTVLYLCATNFMISLYHLISRVPAVRTYYKLPKLDLTKASNNSFMEQLRDMDKYSNEMVEKHIMPRLRKKGGRRRVAPPVSPNTFLSREAMKKAKVERAKNMRVSAK